MNERPPVNKSIDRTTEEVRLRSVIQQLEREAGQPMVKIKVRGESLSRDFDKEIIEAENSLREIQSKDVAKPNNVSVGDISILDTDKLNKESIDIKISDGGESKQEKEESSETSLDYSEKNAIKAGVDEARKKMLEAESAYLKAYKGKVKRGVISGLSTSAKEERAQVKELEKEYNDARLEFSQAVNASVRERLNKKNRGVVQVGTTKEGKIVGHTKDAYTENPDRKDAVLRRYNRMILSRDVIVRAEKERTKIKQEALNEKGQSVFKKALGLYVNGNKKLESYFIKKLGNEKRGKTVARGTRILAFATIGSLAGGVAVGQQVVRSGLSVLFGTAFGYGAGKLYERTGGQNRVKELKNRSEQGLSSMEELQKLEKAYQKGSKENVEKTRHKIEAGVAILTGVGISLETAHLFAGYATQEVVNHASSHAEHLSHTTHTSPVAENVAHTAKHVASSAKESHIASVHIDKSGEGADALFGDLKHKLRELYPDIAKAPPEAQHILRTPLHKLSTEYGFAKPQVHESGLMHMGDRLEYNPTNGHLVFTGTHGMQHTLASDAGGHVVKGESFSDFNNHYTHDVIKNTHISTQTPVHGQVSNTPPEPTPVISSTSTSSSVSHVANSSAHQTVSGTHSAISTKHNTGIGHDWYDDTPPVAHVHNHSMPEVLSKAHDSAQSVHKVAESSVHKVAESTKSVAQITKESTSLHKEIEQLLSPNELGKHANASVADVIYNSPHVSPELHKQLADVVARSGVGPENNETLAQFLHRAQSVSATHGPVYEMGAHGIRIPVNETHLYTDARGNTVAYGGDYNARAFMAYQWLHTHPGHTVFLPNADGSSSFRMRMFSHGGTGATNRAGISLIPLYGGHAVIETNKLSALTSVTH